jgi:hypothetical protein
VETIDFTAIALFLAIIAPIKWLIDARFRHRMIQSGLTGDLQKEWIANELEQRRQSALRWGTVLVALAIGFAIIAMGGWTEITAAPVAVLAAATGIGNLVYFALTRREEPRRPGGTAG